MHQRALGADACSFRRPGSLEVLQHGHELLAVAFRPDGKEIATASLEGHIHFWDPLEGALQVPKPSSNPQNDLLQATLAV